MDYISVKKLRRNSIYLNAAYKNSAKPTGLRVAKWSAASG